MGKSIVDKLVKLEKYPGKGGWTYARLPEVPPDKKAWFNWVRVKGSIDGHIIQAYRLMSMGNGELFLPVKAEIRKKIKKESGDTVHVILYKDNDPVTVPQELLECLRDEPKAHKKFFALTDNDRKQWIDWIYSVRKEDTRVARIVDAIRKISAGEKLS